jgi:hypothetical protein
VSFRGPSREYWTGASDKETSESQLDDLLVDSPALAVVVVVPPSGASPR